MEEESPKITSRLRSRRLISVDSEKDKNVNQSQVEAAHRTPQKKAGRSKQNEFSTPSKSDTPRRITRRSSLTAESSPAVVPTTPKRTRAQSLAVIDEIKDVNSIQYAGMIRKCYVLVKNLKILDQKICHPDPFQAVEDENNKKVTKRFRSNIKKSYTSLIDDTNNTKIVDETKKLRSRRETKLNDILEGDSGQKNAEDNKNNSNNNISSEFDATSSSKGSPFKNKNKNISANMELEKTDINISNKSLIKENEALNDMENTENKSLICEPIEEDIEKNDSGSENGIENQSNRKEMNYSKLDNQSDVHKVTFEESLIDHNHSGTKYYKTPYLSKTKSILDDNISAINASVKGFGEELNDDTKVRSFNLSITENDNDKEKAIIKEAKHNRITPFRKLSHDGSLPSSTPVNKIRLTALSHSIDSTKNRNQNELNFSWNQSTHGKAGGKLDSFNKTEAKEKEVIAITTELKKKSKNKVIVSDDEDEDENEEEVNFENEFIDDEASVGEDESVGEEERQYLKDNEIPVDGISLGSNDSDQHTSDEEYEKDSFVVSDEDVRLLSVSDDEGINEHEKSSKKSKKFKRLEQVSSDSENDSKLLVSNKNNNDSTSGKLHLSVQKNESGKDETKCDLPKERHSIYIPNISNKSPSLWKNSSSVETANITLAQAADVDEQNDPLNASSVNKKNDSHFIDANNMTVFDQQNSEELDPLSVSRLATSIIEKNRSPNLSSSKKKKHSISLENNISFEKSFNTEIPEEEESLRKKIASNILKLNTPDRKISEEERATKSPGKVSKRLSKLSMLEKNNHNESEEKDCIPQAESEISGSANVSLKEKKEKSILAHEETDLHHNGPSEEDVKKISLKNILDNVENNYNESEDEDYNPPVEYKDSSDSYNSSQDEEKEIEILDNNKESETIMQTSDILTNSLSTSFKVNSERVKELAKDFCDNTVRGHVPENVDDLSNQSQERIETNKNGKTINGNIKKLPALQSKNSKDSDTSESSGKENQDFEMASYSEKLKRKEKNDNIFNAEAESDSELTMEHILNRCEDILTKANRDKEEIKSRTKKNKYPKKRSIKNAEKKKMLEKKSSFKALEEKKQLEQGKDKIISSKIAKKVDQKKSKLLSKDILNAINTDYEVKEVDAFEGTEIKKGKKRKHESTDEEPLFEHHKKIKLINRETSGSELAEDKISSNKTKAEKLAIDNKNMKRSNKRKMSDDETVVSQLKIFKTSSGLVFEEPLTPERNNKKKNIISKFKTKTGIVVEEPLTPASKKIQNGFVEEHLSPKPIGYKVRRILSAGQSEVPTILKSEEKKSRNKINICEPTSRLPKPVWSQSGVFYEKKISNILSTIPIELNKPCSTNFGVCPLESKKSKNGHDLNVKAFEFKAKSLKNEKNIRESSKDLLRRKARQHMFKKF